jgi:hypothetical protein
MLQQIEDNFQETVVAIAEAFSHHMQASDEQADVQMVSTNQFQSFFEESFMTV